MRRATPNQTLQAAAKKCCIIEVATCHHAAEADERVFNQVEIDPEVHALVWPNGADFDPETLHDWLK